MARKNFRGYLQDDMVRYKKYLYVLRPLLAVKWIDAGRGMPPMRFAELVAGTVDDPVLIAEINALLESKMRAGEAEYGPRRPAIHRFIEASLADVQSPSNYKRPDGDATALDLYLRSVIPR
jgi:predicted nucleotidyltransferase